jgi:hypothetical protein
MSLPFELSFALFKLWILIIYIDLYFAMFIVIFSLFLLLFEYYHYCIYDPVLNTPGF